MRGMPKNFCVHSGVVLKFGIYIRCQVRVYECTECQACTRLYFPHQTLGTHSWVVADTNSSIRVIHLVPFHLNKIKHNVKKLRVPKIQTSNWESMWLSRYVGVEFGGRSGFFFFCWTDPDAGVNICASPNGSWNLWMEPIGGRWGKTQIKSTQLKRNHIATRRMDTPVRLPLTDGGLCTHIHHLPTLFSEESSHVMWEKEKEEEKKKGISLTLTTKNLFTSFPEEPIFHKPI